MGLKTRLASPFIVAFKAAIAAKRSHVSVAISVRVALTISVAVAKLMPVAVIGPSVFAARIGVVRLSVPVVFASHLETVTISNLMRCARSMTGIVVAVSAIVTVVITVIAPILRTRQAGSDDDRQSQRCHAK